MFEFAASSTFIFKSKITFKYIVPMLSVYECDYFFDLTHSIVCRLMLLISSADDNSLKTFPTNSQRVNLMK